MPQDENMIMPNQNAVPAGVQQGDMANDMNVQTEGLIDDVSNGKFQSQQMPLNNLDEARSAMEKLIMNREQSVVDEQQPAQIESSPFEQNLGVMPDSTQIDSMIQDAIAKAVASGQLADLSVNDTVEALGNNNTMSGEELEEDEIVIPDINSAEFYEEFAENPGESIMKVAEALASQKVRELTKQLEPVLKQSEDLRYRQSVKDAMNKFADDSGYTDIADLREDIVGFLKDGDYDLTDSTIYEKAYNNAKIKRLQQENNALRQNQGKTLGDYFNDEDSLNAMAENEAVKKRAVDAYLKGLRSGNSPQTISAGTSNMPSGAMPSKASTLREARAMALKRLQ